MQPFKDIIQATSKTNIDGSEQGINIQGAKAIRVIVRAPAGQTFNAGFSVGFATRHARLGKVLTHSGGSAIATNVSDYAPHAQYIEVPDGVASEQSGLLIGHIPVAGDFGDELIAAVIGADIGGTPADGTEAGKVFIHLERLER